MVVVPFFHSYHSLQEGESRANEEERMVDTLQKALDRDAGEWERPEGSEGSGLPKLGVAELNEMLKGPKP